MGNYFILLPPSEGKTKGGDENKPYRLVENLSKYNSFTKLINERGYIYEHLLYATNYYSFEELEKIFELKSKNLDEAIDNVQDMLNLPTKPAIERFSGVMFKAINYDSLEDIQKKNFDENTLFIDGLFGLLKPQDYIPEYKLKITFKIGDVDVCKYWKREMGGVMNNLLHKKIVVDMLPQTHKKAISLPIDCEYIQIVFAKLKDNKLKEEGHNSKKLKGELVRYIVDYDNISRVMLKNFVHSQGYKFSEDYSSEDKIVFLKKD